MNEVANHEVMGVRVNAFTLANFLDTITAGVAGGEKTVIANHNLHSIYLFHSDAEMHRFYDLAEHVFVDGMPVVWAGELSGLPLRRENRLTVLDWIYPFAERAAGEGWRVFFLGSAPGIGQRAAEILRGRYPAMEIATWHGYFDSRPGSKENKAVLDKIEAYRPNVLLVGMGMPRQERWILNNFARLPAGVIMPVGAIMDYLAGVVPTPPRWAGRWGLEWLFRLAAEPKRLFSRYIVEPDLLGLLLISESLSKRFWRHPPHATATVSANPGSLTESTAAEQLASPDVPPDGNDSGLATDPADLPDLPSTPRESVDCVVVVPIGPNVAQDFILDTLESVEYYMRKPHKVILLDDSGAGMAESVRRHFPGCVVLENRERGGWAAGLYVTLSKGYRYAVDHFKFRVILKLDTDALVTGPAPDQDAIRYFDEHPECGILGSWRFDCNGDLRSFRKQGRDFRRALRQLPWFRISRRAPYFSWRRDPRGLKLARDLFRRASAHGYQPGEHAQGGAYFLSAECVRRMAHADLLGRTDLAWLPLGEDHIFGLLSYAVGLPPGDFATGDRPLAIRFRGIPCPPQEIVARRKKIVHSTRFWQEMNEAEIRKFFRDLRMAQEPPC